MRHLMWLVPLLLIPPAAFGQQAFDVNRGNKPVVINRQGHAQHPRIIDFAGDPHPITLEPPGEESDPEGMIDSDPDEKSGDATVMARENFDRWIYGTGWTAEARRTHLNKVLKGKVNGAVRGLRLGEHEREKLELAARGDIKRLFNRADAERRSFEAARLEFAAGRAVLMGLDSITLDFQKGPFGEDSLFAKTLRKIESDRKEAR
jgi:hypothetical protein